MKKFRTLLFASLMALTLFMMTACGSRDSASNNTGTNKSAAGGETANNTPGANNGGIGDTTTGTPGSEMDGTGASSIADMNNNGDEYENVNDVTAGDETGSKNHSLIGDADKAVDDVGNAVGDAVSDVGNAVGDVIDDVTDGIDNALDGASNSTRKGTSVNRTSTNSVTGKTRTTR